MGIELLTWLTTYTLIILCELGDKTQLAVLMLSSNNPRQRWLILLGSAVALVLCVVIEVTVGVTLARHFGPEKINRLAGVVFLAFGLYTLASYWAESRRRPAEMPSRPCARECAVDSSK